MLRQGRPLTRLCIAWGLEVANFWPLAITSKQSPYLFRYIRGCRGIGDASRAIVIQGYR